MLLTQWEGIFNDLSEKLIAQLKSDEHLSLELSGENSHFIRFNRAKVRQTGTVTDCTLKINLSQANRTAYSAFSFVGNLEIDLANALDNLAYLRAEIIQLPEDPYLVLPANLGSSREVYKGDLLNPADTISEILSPVEGLDFTGFYADGEVVRALQNSAGQKHWFLTESFFLDYSLISPAEKAVKLVLAGQEWQSTSYQDQIQQGKAQLALLDTSPRTIKPGRYRIYLAPSATADLVGILSWGGISEASLRQGGSALAKLREGKTLSPLFTLKENFQGGHVPRFNGLGEVTAEELPLIVEGKLINTLINSRTAKEYELESNAASSGEGLRSPEINAGTLKRENILKQLDTGLYLSNLHYLNWSDRPSGRITGMTRYACFWVEKGEIVAPIKDLRFDESLYAFFGDNLLNLTDFQEFIPETGTYESRSLGGQLVPGLLVEDFTFTL